jgi:hypothetical protein
MGQVARDVPHRAREGGRQSRLGWFTLITAFNLILWSGVIALITRVT